MGSTDQRVREGDSEWHAQVGRQLAAKKEETVIVKDVVCGCILDCEGAAGQTEYQGDTYYFCSRSCKLEFDRTLVIHTAPRARREARRIPAGSIPARQLERHWQA